MSIAASLVVTRAAFIAFALSVAGSFAMVPTASAADAIAQLKAFPVAALAARGEL